MKKSYLSIFLMSLLAFSYLDAQILSQKPDAYWSFENAPSKMGEVFYSQYGEVETQWFDYALATNCELLEDDFGYAVKFDFESPHIVTTSNPLAGTVNGTISFWTKFRQIDNQYRGLVSHFTTSDNPAIDNWAVNFNGGKKAFDFRTAGQAGYCTDVEVVAEKWYHLVYTWEQKTDSTTQCNYYINNVKQAQSRIISGLYTDGADEIAVFKFGEDRDSKRRPRATLDEILMYKNVLSVDQIDSLYTQGILGEPFQRDILDSIYVSPETSELFEGQSREITSEPFPTEASLKDGFTYTSSNPSVVSIDENGTYKCLAAGSATLTQTFKGNTTISGTCEVTVNARETSIDAFPVAFWPMESLDNYSSTYDWISNVYASGSPDFGQVGFWQAPMFNFGGSYLKTTVNPIKHAQEATIMAWVNLRETDNQYRGLITQNKADYGNWGFNKHTDNKIDARFNGVSVKGDNALEANRWYHVAITFVADDAEINSDCKLYIDGQLQSNSKSVAGVYADVKNDPAVWVFGTDRDLSNRVPRANLDDVAMFDNALTQAQIQSLIEDQKPMAIQLGLKPQTEDVIMNYSRVQYDYDMGKWWSPVLENWGSISSETKGDIAWDITPDAFDCGAVSGINEANQDFITSTQEITLSHKVENGEWTVKMNFGDATAATAGTIVKIEGEVLSPAGGISSALGEMAYLESSVNVVDGELNITVSNDNEAWKWTRLTLRRVDTDGRLGTLLTIDDEPIRAAPMSYAKNGTVTVPYAHDLNTWFAFKDLHYNAFRVTWTDALASMQGRDIWTEEEMIENFSHIVSNAEKAGMTAIINYHNVGEQGSRNPKGADYEMTHLEWFWNIMAKNFGNNPRVIFEFQNEPSFSYSGYIKPDFKVRFLEIYDMVRELAPETQLIVFSPSPFSFIDDLILNYYDNFDWNYTTAGYHLYSGNNSDPIKRAANLARTVCTEYDFNINIPSYQYQIDGFEEPHQSMENINQGWMDWGDHQGPLLPHAWLIPDALEKGYAWWIESDVTIKWNTPNSSSLIFEGDCLNVILETEGATPVTELSLYLNGELIGTDTEAPYEYSAVLMDSMVAGNYVLRAALTDSKGGVKYDHLDISVLEGTTKDVQIVTPEATVWVCKDGTRSHTDKVLKQYVGLEDDKELRSYVRFDLKGKDIISFKGARLRVYNNDDSQEAWVMLHEILDDSWDESTVNYADGPKNVGYPGHTALAIGDGNEAVMQLWHTGAWVEYDVTEFIQQEFSSDSVVSFMFSNLYDGADGRFDDNFRSDETVAFGSKDSEFAPQLILSSVVDPLVPLDSAKLSTDAITLNIDSAYQLGYMIYPQDADVLNEFQWSSQSPNIATVSSSGLVTAVSVGQTNISFFNAGSIWEICSVTVNEPISAISDSKSKTIILQPNPATSSFIIEGNLLIEKVTIYNLRGDLIKSVACMSTSKIQIDIDELYSGLYFVNILTVEGQHHIKKLTVE